MLRILSTSLILAALIISGCGKDSANVEQEFFEKPVETQVPDQDITYQVEPEAPPEVVETPEVVEKLEFETVYFDFDAHTLTDSAREILAAHARKLKDNPNVNLLIEGHCDERGTVEYNLALGDKRAHTVKSYMANFGIEGKRLSTISYGKERPADTEHSEAAWAKNRRAQFVIME